MVNDSVLVFLGMAIVVDPWDGKRSPKGKLLRNQYNQNLDQIYYLLFRAEYKSRHGEMNRFLMTKTTREMRVLPSYGPNIPSKVLLKPKPRILSSRQDILIFYPQFYVVQDVATKVSSELIGDFLSYIS